MGFGKDNRGVIIRHSAAITLLTLNGGAVEIQDTPPTWEEDFRLMKSEYYFSLQGATFVEDDGPLIFGIAFGDLTAAEIAEVLVLDGPFARDDRVTTEIAERPVWLICQIRNSLQASVDAQEYLEPLVTKSPRWTFSDPDGFVYFAFNMGQGALTTGGVLRIVAKHYGVWVT